MFCTRLRKCRLFGDCLNCDLMFARLNAVDGVYVDEGWVDKTFRYCRKDTKDSPRQVDLSGVMRMLLAPRIDPKGFFSKLFGK